MTRVRLVLLASLVLGLAACGAYGGSDGGGTGTDGGGGTVADGGGTGATDGGTANDGGNGSNADGGYAGWCGPAAPPSAANLCCTSCTPGSANCQANGCYNGWWCDTSACGCVAPPTTCGAGTDGGTVTDGGTGGTGGTDGGTVTDGGNGGNPGWCGPAAPPSTPNLCCTSCTPGSGNCQANGCYNGWWCDTSTCACEAPPSSCGGGTDGGTTGGGTDGGTGGTDGGSGGGGTGSLHVLFDDAHAEQAGNADWIIDSNMPIPAPSSPTTGTDWTGAYSSFGVALYKDGDTLETLPPGGQLTYGSGGAQDLSHFQVLVLPEPNDTLSASEIQAIDAFVRAGGGLLAISDHGNADRNHSGADAVQILDQLFASDSWGVHLDGSNDSGTVQATSGAAPMRGPYGSVSTLGCWNGSTMTLDTATNPSVLELATLAGGTFDAAGQLGAGRFVVHGDSSSADDGTATNWTKPQYDAWDHTSADPYDDAVFFQNAVAWLGQRY